MPCIPRGRARTLILLAACVMGSVAQAQSLTHAPNELFRHGFERIQDGPFSDTEAARFLAQATFGTTAADITHLRTVGYEGWFNEQFAAAPAGSQVAFIDWYATRACTPVPDCQSTHDGVRLGAWAITAVGLPDPSRPGYPNNASKDQLRQRLAYALSQILVVSNDHPDLSNQVRALGGYNDLLAADAFANYRTLLEDVTKSPAMAIYLSMLQNHKADDANNVHPDENYAREINQLFSVGLVKLNLDGTPVRVGGQTVPTYGQATVRGFAAVFTGWNWNSSPASQCGVVTGYGVCCTENTYDWCGPGDGEAPAWRLPLQPVEAQHDTTSDKQLLVYPGVALPNGILVHGGNAQAELTAALDNIFHHPNVGPFLATRLIQRFVTSNPTPAYVQRVAQVFNDDGSAAHVRGNLKAVIKAILLDPEARFGHWQQPDSFGKLREPVLKLTHLWRALDARSPQGYVDNFITWPYIEEWLGQAPLRSPSVFNFYRPDYVHTGEIATRGLRSPEFQILNEGTAVATPNRLVHETFCFYTGSDACWDSDGGGTLQQRQELDAALALANPGALIDEYNLVFMSGQMSPFMRQVLLDRVNAITEGTTPGLERVHHLLYLILGSPEYSIQK